MDANGMVLLMMVSGLLIVTLFFYGGEFALRFIESPDRSKVPDY